MIEKQELNSLNLKELEELVVSLGEKKFRASQIFNFIHKNKINKIEDITTLSKNFRNKLVENSYINKINIFKRYDSKLDNTKKYLYLLEDNNIIEAVAMEYKHGTSICISTQVGCKMGCSFCASTKGGLIRDLTPAEMLEQVYEIEKDLGHDISNIVLMGSGEPLDNYENVIKFIDIVTNENGRNLSMRSITLSTCGVVPSIYKLADEDIPITLAISLHSAFDDKRKEIMPIANKYTISEIVEACKYYIDKTGRRVSFEYTLIRDVNDRKEDALELYQILKGLKAHLNLIPLNPIKEFNETNSSDDSIKKFKKILEDKGITTTIRREMGRDISASCGQLRRSALENRDI